MKDEYRITETTGSRRDTLRPLLWLGLILNGAANAIISSAVGNPFLGSAFGVVALAFATALIVHHYRTRDRG